MYIVATSIYVVYTSDYPDTPMLASNDFVLVRFGVTVIEISRLEGR